MLSVAGRDAQISAATLSFWAATPTFWKSKRRDALILLSILISMHDSWEFSRRYGEQPPLPFSPRGSFDSIFYGIHFETWKLMYNSHKASLFGAKSKIIQQNWNQNGVSGSWHGNTIVLAETKMINVRQNCIIVASKKCINRKYFGLTAVMPVNSRISLKLLSISP